MNRRATLFAFDVVWVVFGLYMLFHGIVGTTGVERIVEVCMGVALVFINAFRGYERIFHEGDDDE